MYAYFRTSQDYKGLAILVKWTMILVGITAIMSIISSVIDPFYARKLIAGEGVGDIIKFGGGAYGFASALVCLFL